MTPRRMLGNTGIEVSVISLGTVKFGRNQSVKYPKLFNLPTDVEIAALLQNAKELGINLLDTAPAYGKSEERLGQCLKKAGNRSDWIIASKFGETFDNGVSSFDFSREAALRSIDESLRRLQTDYLDLVLVHSNGDDVEIIKKYGVFETLSELKKSGKIRAFGMSTKTVEGGLLAVEKSDVVMVTYNPAEIAEQAVIAYAHKLGKGSLIKKALASGHIDKLSKDSNPVEKSIHFILEEPGVSSIVIGTLSSQHLEEAVRYANKVVTPQQQASAPLIKSAL
jgi:aryl-alcohol dehydrogenase-like predicted oxidoreductase